MAATRKLQTEIQQCLKKVDEGVEMFDEIWSKVYTSDSQTLKEKFEADLKKEIKKLQRLRDNIKAWLGNSEIKDKTQLTEARKRIEGKMEQFKVCERDTKTKAYSKEGLARDSRLDPKEAAREEKRNWLNECLDRIQDLNNAVEAEKEKLSSAKTKGKNKDELAKLDNRLQKQKWHIAKIELIIKLIDNEELEPSLIDGIKEHLEYYLETAPDDDGEVGVEHEFDIYEDLNLDSFNVAASTFDIAARHTSSSQDEEHSPPPVGLAASAAPAITPTAPVTAPSTASAVDGKSAAKAPSAPVQSTTDKATPLAQIVKGPKSGGSEKAEKSESSTPPPGIPISRGSAAKDDSAEAKPVAAIKAPANDSPRASGKIETPAAPAAKANPPAPVATPAAATTAPSTAPPNATKIPVASILKSVVPTSTASSTAGSVVSGKNSPAVTSPPGMTNVSASSALPPAATPAPAPTSAPTSAPAPVPVSVPASASVAVTPSNPPALAAIAAPAPPANPIALLTLEQQQALLILKQSAVYMPEEFQYIPKYPNPTSHPAFPTAPIPSSNAEYATLFDRLPLDTLFFAFYYQQNSYQQALAAKRLKKNSWRYHKKYSMWFQRHSEPKVATQDFEEGAYVYFDHDGGWQQRVQPEFKFEYGFLEDELN